MNRILVFGLCFLMTAALLRDALGEESKLENVAHGKTYTMEPAPAYAHCTDAGDYTQLTDGAYTSGYFWTQPSTVGWYGTKHVIITLDLGSVRPIRGVSLNTAAGAAGVTWPSSIDLFVADQPDAFHSVAELTALDNPHGAPASTGYALHRYWTDALHTHGRYVAFVASVGSYFFSDEIEVYLGSPEWLSEPLPGESVGDLRSYTATTQVVSSVRRRIRDDALALKAKIEQSALSEEYKSALVQRTAVVIDRAATESFAVNKDFRAVLPLNATHQDLFSVNAAYWRRLGLKPLTVWQTGLWDSLSLLADPTLTPAAALDIAVMRHEYRAAAVNLSNASEHPVTCTVYFDGLPGGPCPPYVRTHEVLWTDTATGTPVAAALPDAARSERAWSLTIPAGMTRQAWFTFHPADIEPGSYAGRLVIESDAVTERVPVALHVSALRFPERPTLHFGGWDYTNADRMYGMTPSNRDALIVMLREHFVDTPWATSAALPHGTYDADGKMTTAPDTACFDTWIARWPAAARYHVFAAVGAKLGALSPGAEAFQRAVGEWMRFWADHAKEKGIAPEQLAVLLVDEPSDKAAQALAAEWARAVRAANTGIRVWEDPIFKAADEAVPGFLESCDVLCPNLSLFLEAAPEYRDLFVAKRRSGAALEFYSCSGPVRLLDPYSYFRLQPWACRRYGATASYFWAFGDNSGVSSWNEYTLPRAAFTPLFLDDTSCVTGKHLEAAREGVEDYEYFVMVEKAVAQAKDSDAVRRAKTLLGELPVKVCDAGRLPSMQWADPLDRTLADKARREVLAILEELAAVGQ